MIRGGGRRSRRRIPSPAPPTPWATEEKLREVRDRLDAAERRRKEVEAQGLVAMPERLWIASEQAARAREREVTLPTQVLRRDEQGSEPQFAVRAGRFRDVGLAPPRGIESPREWREKESERLRDEHYGREVEAQRRAGRAENVRLRRLGVAPPSRISSAGIWLEPEFARFSHPRETVEFPSIQRFKEHARGLTGLSAYGKEMLERVPVTRLTRAERKLYGGYFTGPEERYPHGRIAVPGGGEALLHEMGHAAGAPWWTEDVAEDFLADVLRWVKGKPLREMTGDELHLYQSYLDAVSGRGNIGELYAIGAQRPQAIPPELAHWFPQWELRRRPRQFMGWEHRPEYPAPRLSQYGGRFPPPPPGVGYGPRTLR